MDVNDVWPHSFQLCTDQLFTRRRVDRSHRGFYPAEGRFDIVIVCPQDLNRMSMASEQLALRLNDVVFAPALLVAIVDDQNSHLVEP